MNTSRFLKAVFISAVLAGCMPKIPSFEPVHRDEPDAAAGAAGPVIILVPELCRKACKNMVKLGCAGRMGSPGVDEVFGTGDDDSCEIVCSRIEEASKEVPGWSLNPGCLALAKGCDEATRCVRTSSGL